jgi:hypothetical protein
MTMFETADRPASYHMPGVPMRRRSNRHNPGGDSKPPKKVRTAVSAAIGDISACGWNSLSDLWNSLSS